MRNRSHSDLVVDIVLIAVAAAWGGSFLAAKDVALEVGVAAAVALRFVVAAAAIGLISAARRIPIPRGRGAIIATGLGLSQAAVIGVETWGVTMTSATNAGLLISISLLITPVLESIVARSWLPRRFFAAAAVSLTGVALLVSGGGFTAPSFGDLLIVGAACVRAGHVTLSARLLRHRAEHSLGVVTVQMLVCAVAFVAIAEARPGAVIDGGAVAALSALSPQGWAGVLFLGLVCSVFAFAAQLWAVRRTSAARASILMGTEPVWAMLAGVVVGGEQLAGPSAIGALLIVAAGYLGGSIERRHRSTRITVESEAIRSNRSKSPSGMEIAVFVRRSVTRHTSMSDRMRDRAKCPSASDSALRK